MDALARTDAGRAGACPTCGGGLRDPLTGLVARDVFFHQLDKELDRHRRYGTEASLAIFDVDDLGVVNSTLGRPAGDGVLRAVADVLQGRVRPSDTLARVGGDAFGVLLPETTRMEALLAADRLRTAVAKADLVPGRAVTVSAGVAAVPDDGATVEVLERRVEAALGWVKAHGKDLCAVARDVGDAAVRPGMLAHLHAVVAGIDAARLATRDHSVTVAAYAGAIANALDFREERTVRLRRAAFLHDIGKVAVPEAVLEKPGRLTDEEFAQVQLHPQVGSTMLAHAGLHEEASFVRHHHERLDGRGYPDGLAGADIPLESRVIFVADSFEAMTSDRPYRPGLEVDVALAELAACAGSQFDPAVVAAFDRQLREGRVEVRALRHQG
ncbi:HD-GYP domain-containing protein [Conexibacter sp. SYSU D00693]|uniref:HD-GYP domain-containing protein n=1 Tax=Conexibacter sp. SYSU D00693 TaxID=2812560 RepID=UPI00196B8C4E|nr:diguanylate cyclase [Conexibacter sp. SYSU D00693]